MRRPSLTRKVVADLECLAAVARSALAGQAASGQMPGERVAVQRALAYVEGLARWRRSTAPPAAAPVSPPGA